MAVHVVSPPRRMGLTGLTVQLRINCNSASCVKLACVIDADLMAISHVSGSQQLGRAMHEVTTISTSGRAFGT